jgi:hypothetical protein
MKLQKRNRFKKSPKRRFSDRFKLFCFDRQMMSLGGAPLVSDSQRIFGNLHVDRAQSWLFAHKSVDRQGSARILIRDFLIG